jgi:hypothetical protein
MTMLVLALGFFLGTTANGQDVERPERPPRLPEEREMALALSAAPPVVAEHAAVYVLDNRGYVKVRDGSNGYTCLVSRSDHVLDLTPVCHDASGTERMLPIALLREELRAAGRSDAEIKQTIAEGFLSGRFRAPRAGGISYMLSTEGYTYDAANKRKQPVPPHVMVYAPYFVNADLGFPDERLGEMARAGLPFMRYPGTPDAFIIMLTPQWATRGSGAENHHER